MFYLESNIDNRCLSQKLVVKWMAFIRVVILDEFAGERILATSCVQPIHQAPLEKGML